MTLATFAVGLADVVTGAAWASGGRDVVAPPCRLGPGVTIPLVTPPFAPPPPKLAQLPLYVEAGNTISTDDVYAVAEGELVDFVVVGNYELLLPSESATDLKHCTTALNVAALAATTRPGTNDDRGVAWLGGDLLAAADTIACYDQGGQSCRVVVTRAWP